MRSLGSSARCRALRRAIPTLPLQRAGFGAWALGEAEGLWPSKGAGPDADPSPPLARPLVGHLLRWRSDPLGLLADCARDPAPASRLRIVRPAFVLKRPQDVRAVLVAEPERYPKSGRTSGAVGRLLTGGGMISKPSAASAGYAEGRAAVERRLSGRAADVYLERVDRAIRPIVARWGDGDVIDLTAEIVAIARTAMLAAVFGVEPADATARRLEGGIALRRRRFARAIGARVPRVGWPAGGPDPGGLAATIDGLLGACLAAPAPPEDAREPTLIELLAAEVRAGRLDAAAARGELETLALVGYRTVAAGATWALYELVRHPAEREAVEREIAALHPLDAAQAATLPHARAAVEEALRLHPPSWVFTRVAAEPTRLPSGARVGRHAKVLVAPYLIHRLPELWERPHEFEPARFLAGGGRSRPRFAYLPFGAGRRVCVGRSFALNEMTLIVTRLLGSHRLTPRSGAVGHRAGVTLLPDGTIRVEVSPR
jgi:cytochrome P450